MIDVERLKHDRDYWDEVGAPEDATHYIVPNSQAWSKAGFFVETDDRYIRIGSGGHYRLKEDLHMYSLIPRPTRKQWSGPEYGLPPQGEECEYRCIGSRGQRGPWFVCTVKYVLDCDHDTDADGWQAVIYCPHLGKEQYATLDKFEFRPLKSEKERVVEAVMGVAGFGENMRYGLELAYDAGALNMPEEEQ